MNMSSLSASSLSSFCICLLGHSQSINLCMCWYFKVGGLNHCQPCWLWIEFTSIFLLHFTVSGICHHALLWHSLCCFLCYFWLPFLDQELISYRYSSCFFYCCSCLVTSSKRAKGSVISNRIWMKFGRIVLQVNTHRLMESDFWYDVILSRWQPWRAFSYAAPAAWNSLLPTLQQISNTASFKRHLKTFLYQLAYLD